MSDEFGDLDPIRTPRQIIEEFALQTAGILSGRNARSDKHSRIGGEAMKKFRPTQSVATRGLGHSGWACTGGRDS